MDTREVSQDSGAQQAENRPLRLGDIEDNKKLPERYTEHSAVVAGGSLLSLLGLCVNRPTPPDFMLKPETTAALRTSTHEMRQMLTHNVVIPTEQAMSRLGWQRVSGSAFEEVAWRVPPGREILLRTGFDNSVAGLHGKQGLPSKSSLWRNVDGSVFFANPAHHPSRYKLITELSSTEMRAGTTNGVLTPREGRLVNRLAAAEQELQRLSYLEAQLARNSVVHLQALQPHGSASGTSLGEPSVVGRHNTVLATARNEMLAPEEAYSKATRNAWKNAGILVCSQVANHHLDREFFHDARISVRTSVIDGASPLIAMTRLHWSAKAAVMVGSHLSSRWFDAEASRK